MHTIKPLDEKAILDSIAVTGCLVSAEEHNIKGGLGESIASVLVRNRPVPQEFVAVMDTFGESGTPTELMAKYHLNAEAIVSKAERAISRKRK